MFRFLRRFSVQKTDVVSIAVGEATLSVPAELAARAYLEKFMLPISLPTGFAATPTKNQLPAIGDPWQGGIYAGITLHNGIAMALVLLPFEVNDIKWGAAGTWAKEQGGELPSRIDALVLFENLKKEFSENWYWTATQHPGIESCAYVQYFDNGDQRWDRKDDGYRARAVRRFPIE